MNFKSIILYNVSYKVFFLILFLLFSHIIYAQQWSLERDANEGHKHHISVSYGASYPLKIDYTYSRLAKEGWLNAFGLDYQYIDDRKTLGMQALFTTGTLSSIGNEVNRVSIYDGIFRLKYLKKVDVDFPFDLYLGGSSGITLSTWLPKQSRLRYAWDTYLNIALATELRYKINKKFSASYSLNIPLIGVLWRSHNNGQQLTTEEILFEQGFVSAMFETPVLGYPFNALYVDHSLKISYALFRRLDVYYNLLVSYEYLSTPLAKKGYETMNMLGVTFRF